MLVCLDNPGGHPRQRPHVVAVPDLCAHMARISFAIQRISLADDDRDLHSRRWTSFHHPSQAQSQRTAYQGVQQLVVASIALHPDLDGLVTRAGDEARVAGADAADLHRCC